MLSVKDLQIIYIGLSLLSFLWIFLNSDQLPRFTFYLQEETALPSSCQLLENYDEAYPIKKIMKFGGWFPPKPLYCPSRGLISLNFKNTLESYIGGYSTLWSLAQQDLLYPVVTSTTISQLLLLFPYLTIRSRYNTSFIHANCTVYWEYLKYQELLDIKQKCPAYHKMVNIFLKDFPSDIELALIYREYIRNDFQVSPAAREPIDKLFQKASANMSSSTYIGTHVIVGKQQTTETRERLRKYLVNAMQFFMDLYADALFVISSDDVVWCYSVLSSSRFKIKYYGGNGKSTNDLLVLILSNHTIRTTGEFGLWASFLTGGIVVQPAYIKQPVTGWITI